MWYYLIKLVISAVLIVLVSEVSKRTPLFGGLIASLPLVSYLAIIWLYIDKRDEQQIAELSWSILWLVIPSLTLFVALPLLLKKLPFTPSLIIATLIMFASYAGMMAGLQAVGVDTGGGQKKAAPEAESTSGADQPPHAPSP